jgi:Putative peptidoglycan binding domain/Phage tail lysozyme
MRFNEFRIREDRDLFHIDVPKGRRGTEVRDVQQALLALGYSLPRHGADGIRGPETVSAIKAFQTDNKITVDGDPGPETVDKLNDILKTKPEITGKLVKSLPTDVKTPIRSGSMGPIDFNSDTSTGKQQGFKNLVPPKEMAEYLANKGYDKNSIAGLLANAQGESGFNSGAYITSDAGQGQGGGLFGFHDPVDGRGEFTNMVRACGPKWQTNWQGQLDYALQASGYPKSGFASPGSAAAWFVKNYERPKYPAQAINQRTDYANNIAGTMVA